MKETALLYSSFNARQLTPEEVAETFVAPPQYEQLCKAEHTLLLGPRGSGKTTLLKMLTAPALRAWLKKGDVDVRHLPFKSIYIPADVLWTSQLDDIAQQGIEPALAETLVRAAVTANIQYSMVETFEQLDETLRHSEQERSVAAQVAQEWQLSSAFPSYYGLRKALKARVGAIRALVGVLQQAHDLDTLGRPIPEFVYSDFWHAASIAVEVFQHEYKLPQGQRWALCFDELEISPEWLRRKLLESLRSTEQRFILKLSASPMQPGAVDSYRPSAAQEGQDYRVVRLWYSGPAEARTFCHRLAQRTLSRAFGRSVDPHEVLGRSSFAQDDTDSIRGPSQYQPGSRFWKELQEAAFHDPSLRLLLKDRGIDLSSPEKAGQADRDQLLRKIKPVLMLRNEFRVVGADVRRRQIRSRKQSTLYSGAEALYSLSDGNPRWLIGMLGDILTQAGSEKKLTMTAQAGVLWRASHRFKALLSMLPKASRAWNGNEVALVDIIDAVGRYFFERLVREAFPLDPVGSFVVDAQASDALVELIQLGVSQGALVYVESDWKVVPANPRGKRFRLSFMLAPSYRLPLRLYEPVALSACLKDNLRTRTATGEILADQVDLFDSDT